MILREIPSSGSGELPLSKKGMRNALCSWASLDVFRELMPSTNHIDETVSEPPDGLRGFSTTQWNQRSQVNIMKEDMQLLD